MPDMQTRTGIAGTSRRTFLRQAGAGTAGLGLVGLVSGCRSPVGVRAGELPRATPEAQGVSSEGLLAYLDALAHSRHEMHGFMFVRHGRVVAEGWWAPYGPRFNHTLYSMSKSFVSTAVGLAAAEGRLSVDDPVVGFFPNETPSPVGEKLAALRIRHLLTMSVGNQTEPTSGMVKQDDWVRYFLAAPITHDPGSVFMYNSAATYMCSAIVQRVTGQRVVDYLQPRLFDPLGIAGATWETCPRGINTGGWGLSVPTEALARFGELYLRKGVWRGRRLLPAAWVATATAKHIQQPLPAKSGRPNERNDWLQGYGYQFWRSTHNAYRGDGAFGQFTVVMPDLEAVVAINSESNNMQGELDLVWEYLLPAMSDRPLPPNPAAHNRLLQTLASLALPAPTGTTAVAPLRRPAGDHALAPNALGLQRVAFDFGGDSCRVVFGADKAQYPIAAGYGHWVRGETALPGTPPRLVSGGASPPGTPSKVAAAGAWKNAETFELMMRYYETPHHDTLTFRFSDETVSVAFMNSIAAMSANPKDNRQTLTGSRA